MTKNIIVFSIIFLSVINFVFARYYQSIGGFSNNHSIIKRDSAGGECKNINNLIGKEESFDCCSHTGITCENNHIVAINLNRNQLTGTIPPSIGNLSNLTDLNLNSNQLTGTVPQELGNLINLISLDLGNNKLTGLLPSELANLANLNKLDLSNNEFNDLNLSVLKDLFKVTNANLSNNPLAGEISNEIGNIINTVKSNTFNSTPENPHESVNNETHKNYQPDEKKPVSNKLTIILIIISAVVLLLILIASIYFVYFRKQNKDKNNNVPELPTENNHQDQPNTVFPTSHNTVHLKSKIPSNFNNRKWGERQ